jgi:hypothetical protein
MKFLHMTSESRGGGGDYIPGRNLTSVQPGVSRKRRRRRRRITYM